MQDLTQEPLEKRFEDLIVNSKDQIKDLYDSLSTSVEELGHRIEYELNMVKTNYVTERCTYNDHDTLDSRLDTTIREFKDICKCRDYGDQLMKYGETHYIVCAKHRLVVSRCVERRLLEIRYYPISNLWLYIFERRDG